MLVSLPDAAIDEKVSQILLQARSHACIYRVWRRQDSTVRWAARDAIVKASRDFEIDGTPSTMLSLEKLATNGYNR